MIEALKKTQVDIGFIVPSIIKELSESPELLDYCSKHLQMLIYCGGDHPQAIGDTVFSKIRLLNQFGASEVGLTPLIHPKRGSDPADWKYCRFHPDLEIEFQEVTDGAYELCVKRDSMKTEAQPNFTIGPNFLDIQEYGSRDFFLRHPSKDKADLWKWHARADDIIMFLNGEKTNPISMEQHIVSQCPNVAAVLVAGTQRFQASLPIEPFGAGELSVTDRASFIENIWSTIEEANQDAPSHARISKSHVLLTHPQKPMLRAGKGTVQRAGTMQMYAEEIEALYADAEKTSVTTGEASQPSVDMDDKLEISRHIAESIFTTSKFQDLRDNNFIAAGMNSLQALMLLRSLKQAFAMPELTLTIIYMNPSIPELTSAVANLWKKQQASKASLDQQRIKARKNIVKEYKDLIDDICSGSTSYIAHRSMSRLIQLRYSVAE